MSTIELQPQIKINEDDLNKIFIQHQIYRAKKNKITQKEYLAKLLVLGFEQVERELKKKGN